MLTEQQHSKTLNLDQMDTLEILRIINEEDKRVAFVVEKALPKINQAVDSIVERLQTGGRLIYVGAGTSGRLGVLDAVECVPTFGTSPELVQGIIAGGEAALSHSIEGAEDDADGAQTDLLNISLCAKDVVVAIAASGRTPYVLGAVAYAKSIGAQTIGLACNEPSSLLDETDISIGLVVGAEVITGSTRMKAASACKMVLNMLSSAAMVKLGKVYANLMVDLHITNIKLEQRALHIIMQVAKVNEATAKSLLEAAQGHVKTALVMYFKQVDYLEAGILLEAAQGHLRHLLED